MNHQRTIRSSACSESEKAFTLIELIAALAIVSILAAVILPNVFNQIRKGRVARVLSTSEEVRRASLAFYADNDSYPTQTYVDGAVDSLLVTPTSPVFPKWGGPYLQRSPKRRPLDGRFGDLYNGLLMVNDVDDGQGNDSDIDRNGNGLVSDHFVYYGLVPARDAAVLDQIVDGNISIATGSVVLSSGADWSVSTAGDCEVIIIFDETD